LTMPLFQWHCTKCNYLARKLSSERPKLDPCPKCGAEQEFITNGQSMKMDTLDNGLMVRKIERLHNIEELLKERNNKAKPKEEEII